MVSALDIIGGIPRVVSQNTPNYDVLCGLSLRITLDGEPTEDVVGYDMDAGNITRAQRGADGALLIKHGCVLLEKVRGVVEVTFPSAS